MAVYSPAGAYVPDPDLEGKATFGFVSKYKKGAQVPDGQTEFQFTFRISAGDGAPDTFRIKIWTEDDTGETVVYDNGSDQALGGGSVVVHTKEEVDPLG